MSTLTELFNTPAALSHKYENVSSAVHASRLTLKASPDSEGAICQVVLDGVTITPDGGILGTRLRVALLQYITGTPSDSHDSVDGAVWNLDAKVRLLDDGDIVVRPFHRLNSPVNTAELINSTLHYPCNILITNIYGKVDPTTKHPLFWIDTNNGKNIAVNGHHTYRELSRQLCNYQLPVVDKEGFYSCEVLLMLTIHSATTHSISMVTPANQETKLNGHF